METKWTEVLRIMNQKMDTDNRYDDRLTAEEWSRMMIKAERCKKQAQKKTWISGMNRISSAITGMYNKWSSIAHHPKSK